MVEVGHQNQLCHAGLEGAVQGHGVARGHDPIDGSRHDRGGGAHQGGLGGRIPAIEQQQIHRQPRHGAAGNRQQAVERHQQHQPLHRLRGGQMHRRPGTKAASRHRHRAVALGHVGKQGLGVGAQGRFARSALAAAVAAVVEQIEGGVRQQDGQLGAGEGHVLGIAAEVDQRPGTGVGPMGHQHPLSVHLQLQPAG